MADSEFAVEPLDDEDDLPRSVDLMLACVDARLGFADASIGGMGERLGVPGRCTTDRRQVALVRRRHAGSLPLLP